MPLPVKNTCTPQDIFGGFEQTLFLGCSVISFSIGAGWNEQKGEVTVQLIEDPCSGPKVYYDRNLDRQDYTGADPGFIGIDTPIIGVPVYFRMADFEFSGIIQDWVKADIRDLNMDLPVESWANNVNIYTVKIEDPREILSAAQVIVNEYAGFTTGLDNIVNAYGFLEAIAANCGPITQGIDGTIFGSPAEGFGGADVDDNGMPWNNILAGTRTLLSGQTTYSGLGGVFSNGYLSFKGVSNTGYTGVSGITSGMGVIDQNASFEARYVVDLSSLPVLPYNVRMNGTSFSLLDLISQVCEIAGYDYYIELLPVEGTWGNAVIDTQGIAKFIKVRTVNRAAQPVFGAIEEFIDVSNNDGIGCINNEVGRELRNETTQQLIVGGLKQNVFDTDTVTFTDPEGDGDPANEEADDMVIPYFGLDNDGNAIIPELDADDYWFFEADVRALNLQLNEHSFSLGVDSVTINEKELIASLSSKEAWILYSQKAATDISVAFGDFNSMFNITHLEKVHEALVGGDLIAPRDRLMSNNQLNKVNDATGQNRLTALQMVFDFVNQYATEYYGKQFQVRVPNTCAYIPTSQDGTFVGWGGHVITSEVPSDGGWSEKATLLGLTNPSITTDFFRLEDGRIQNILRFADLNDLSVADLDVSTYIGDTGTATLWVKADAEADYVYMDKATLFSPRVVMSIPAPIDYVTDTKNHQIHGLDVVYAQIGDTANETKSINTLERVGGSQGYVPYGYRKRVPNGAAVCIKSNALRYGPYGAATVAGKAVVKTEDGLVPWEYGSYANMDVAGNELASEGVTYMQVGERGSLVVPGYPTIPLGAELLSASASNSYAGDGPLYTSGAHLFENRTIVVTGVGDGQYVSTSLPLWSGAYGPNITGITCTVSAQGINTTYTMRTYTPKFGKFARQNAERLKQIGQNTMKSAKAIRAMRIGNLRKENNARIASYLKGIQKHSTIHAGKENSINTPHEFLVGEMLPWNSGEFTRPVISDSSMVEFGSEATNSYSTKAFMSWDGLILPVSMDGDGGLPQYSTPDSGCQNTHPQASIPPLDKSGEAGQLNQYNLDINIMYLNPFSNPSGFARSDVSRERSNTPNVGHHVEIIGRAGASGTEPPASSIIMPIQGYMDTDDKSRSDYKDDIRAFALRGPLIIEGWGYDTNGFPVPNESAGESRTAKFADNWLRKPESWPVGPVDLRWDAARAVWVSPPSYKLVRGTIQQDITAGGTGLGVLTDMPTLYDTSGNTISNPEIILHDWIQQPMRSGAKFIANYDTIDCEYHVLHSAGTLKNNSTCNTSFWEAQEGGNVNVATSLLSLGHLDIGHGLVILENATGGYPKLRTSSIISYTSVIETSGDCVEYGSNTSALTNLSIGQGLVGVAPGTGDCAAVELKLDLVVLAPDPLDPCLMWLDGDDAPNQADNFTGWNQIYVRNGLVATTGSTFCNDVPSSIPHLYLGLDIEVSGRDSSLVEKRWHGARGFTFGSGFVVSDSGCLAPITLFYGNNSGSQVIITGVTCSGSSLVVGSGELVWKYGQISGVRPI